MQSEFIGNFVSNNDFSTLPSTVKERTKLAVLNFIAVTIGANAYPQSKQLISACKVIQEGSLPIYGSKETSGLLSSTWANSSLSHLLDFDDTHLESIVHPSAPVIPSSLSLGINNGENGSDIIFASAVGMEVAIRLALAVGLDERYSDWHNTSLYGTAASAVASSIMLHGNADQVSSSMLQGLTVATGFLSNRGTTTKSFQVGRSAAEGIIGAIATKNGISVSKNMINTFAASLSKESNLNVLSEGFGKKWHVLNNFLKPYPCGVVLHPGIDAAIEMRNKNISFNDIEEINVAVNPVVMVLTAILDPKSGLESKFSVTHAIASALLHGPLYPEHFSDSAVADPYTVSLRKKIKVHQMEDINRGQTVIEVKYRNGGKETVDINRGPETPSKLMDTRDVQEKFKHLVEPVMGIDFTKEIWKYFSELPSKADISELKEVF
jgi:2-methylcitrate dehydratase PrpD